VPQQPTSGLAHLTVRFGFVPFSNDTVKKKKEEE
jgi:hypothetical protein